MQKNEQCFIILAYKTGYSQITDLISRLSRFRIYIIDNTPQKDIQLENIFRKHNFSIPVSVSLHTSDHNLGYAGGVNIGLKIAYNDGFDWITVLNPDLRFNRQSIDAYWEQLKTKKPGIAGIYPGYLDAWRYTTITEEKQKNSGDIRYLSGSFISIHRKVLEKTGYLPEEYFLYYEEAEFCIKARNKGIELIYIPAPEIKHVGESALGRSSYLHQYYLARNHLLFVEHNAPIYVKFHEIFRLPKTIWEHYRKGERGALAGIRDYLIPHLGQYKGDIC